MKDRLRKDGDAPLPGDEPDLKTDLIILAVHFLLVAILAIGAFYIEFSIPSMAFGLVLGVALFSLHWRWRYGYWPD